MIDQTAFAVEWTVLEDRFQTRHTPETAARYLDAWDAELSTEQFRAACARVFRFERFFPSPQALIDHALGDFAERAEAAWDAVMLRLAGGQETLTDDGSESRRILNLLGGGAALREGSDYGRRDMREGFTRRYARMLREQAATGQGLNLPETSALRDAAPKSLPGMRGGLGVLGRKTLTAVVDRARK